MSVQTIDRTMLIANLLAAQTVDTGLSISELSEKLHLPLSTLHRILKAMIKQRMVEQDPKTKLYRLGTIWLEYGLQVYDSMDYVNTVRVELDQLSREVEESVYLSKPAELDAIIIERIDNEKNQIRIYDQLGIRIPLHIGAANKAMLAAFPKEKTRAILKRLIQEQEIPELEKKLEDIRKQGYAESHGERTEGTSSIAVSIVNGFGEVVGAVSIGYASFHMTEERLSHMRERLLETGARISKKLGHRS